MWPDEKPETRPWTRWWWLGSAVDKKTLTGLLEEYQRAGLGGVEITPIYGVEGADERNIDYLSPTWCEMLRHTVKEAKRLGMQVDLPPGSGWKMGGSFLDEPLGAARICFEGDEAVIAPSGEMIKRAGPGGGGLAFNPFDHASLQAVIDHFTPALKSSGIRAQFHDSWEYNANARLDIFDVFEKQYSYDLRMHVNNGILPPRVRYDLQHLLAELALKEFIGPWHEWCHALGQLSRNQAHGSPGNLLDLYAACDIPETEVFRRITPDTPLFSKFASSAAHVMGRRLVSSETGTWIGEHYQVTLATLKQLCDNLFIAGINHHVYHGTAYSPDDAPWPGWVFYAATQLNPQNSIWRDIPTLNAYVTRCQSVLQDGAADSDLLVYFPLHDILQDPDHELAGKLHIEGTWLASRPAMETFRNLWKRGYGFDYISDRQLAALDVDGGSLLAPGGTYQAILIPPCEFMPAATLEHLVGLSRDGATIIFSDPAPHDVPGFAHLDDHRARLSALVSDIHATEDVDTALAATDVKRETLVECGDLQWVRRRHAHGHLYFVLNHGDNVIDRWIPLAVDFETAIIMDPMTGHMGSAAMRDGHIRLQLDPGASLIIKTGEVNDEPWPYRETQDAAHVLRGTWHVRFIDGGPTLPTPYKTHVLDSWADRGGDYEAFAGTAEYSLTFDAPEPGGKWLLDLGEVHASARVALNGRHVATLIGPRFKTDLDPLKPTGNQLTIEVTNLAANRIRKMDQDGTAWRIFEDINVVNVDYEPFDASDWPVTDSGLLGPVTLQTLGHLTGQAR